MQPKVDYELGGIIMSLGERIIQLRTDKNMTQYQLAEAMDVSRQAVSKWENDISAPDSNNLIRLTEILDTDLEFLTTGRKSFSRRPPVVIKQVETVEKVVEKPVYIEKIVEVEVEKPVVQYVEKPVLKYVETPVVKKTVRTKYVRHPVEYALVGGVCFILGLLLGIFL